MYYDRPMNNDKGQNDEDEPNGEQ